jgi:hypothetical protein
MDQVQVRFTIRSMIVAVGLVAVFLVLEPFLFHGSVQMVKSDREYHLSEVVWVWIVLNVVFVGIPGAMIWDMVRRRD